MAVTVDDILEARDLSEPRISPDGHWVALVVSDAAGFMCAPHFAR